MTSSFLRSVLALPILAAAGVIGLAASPAQAIDLNKIEPILRSYTGSTGLGFEDNVEYTFGYFFDINSDQYFANGLGFAFQDGWFGSGPTGQSYDVTLWSYILDPNNNFKGTYTQLATTTFTPGDTSLILADSAVPPTGFGNYYWRAISTIIPLANTGSAVDPGGLTGYIVGATGIFGGAGSVLAASDGTADFATPVVNYEFDGYNLPGGEENPIPILAYFNNDPSDVANFNPGQGFWNANVSIDVPGPLPLLGVGAAFGWSRRLKKKTSQRR